ncbi:carbohydrate porin [soil metagenome]
MKHPLFSPRGTAGIIAASFAALITSSPLQAGQPAPTTTESSESWVSSWWNGKYASGNWFGVRNTLEDHGLTLGGKWTGDFYGVVDGGKGGVSGGFFDEEIKFTGQLNFAKLLNVDALEGLTGFGEVRYRDGRNVNNRVGATGNFQPSHLQSGLGWRLMNFGLTYSTPEMFGVKNFLTVTGGWIQPQKEFIDQPLSKLFVNNTFESSKGVGATIPFSSSFSTWGGTVKIKPTDITYIKGGLFMAYPQATSNRNHGLAFQGYDPDQGLNGLFGMFETGITPKFGPAELPGKYAFGSYIYGDWNNSFYGYRSLSHFGFYWQADQMLYREPSPEVEVSGKGPSDGKAVASITDGKATSGKSFKEPVTEKPKLSDQGLYSFTLLTFGPRYNTTLPFYFQTGLVYKGLIPTRDNDQLMAAFGLGNYSLNNIDHLQDDLNNPNQPNFTAVLELDYRLQVTQWAYIQPFFQYIIQPNGTGAIENASILGAQAGIVF